MKTSILTFPVILSTLIFTLPAQAHAPEEHMKDAESPNCAIIKSMDRSKMDMKDPVIQALMKQCMKELHHDGDSESEGHEHGEHEGHTNDKTSTGHRH